MRRLKLKQQDLLDKFYYHEGNLYYKYGLKENRIAGCCKGKYFRIRVNGQTFPLHRMIFLYFYGYLPEKQVDHIDRNTHNNRIENLREASWQCNARNSKIEIRNTSGVKGVSYMAKYKVWRAIIKVDQKFCHIGQSKSFVEAVCLRLAAEQCIKWYKCDSSSSAFNFLKQLI